MTPEPRNLRRVPPPRRGLLHVTDAAAWSLTGARRLMQETAARQELGAAAAVAAAFLWRGARPGTGPDSRFCSR